MDSTALTVTYKQMKKKWACFKNAINVVFCLRCSSNAGCLFPWLLDDAGPAEWLVIFNQIFCERLWSYLFKAVFSCVGRGFSWKDFTASCKDSFTQFPSLELDTTLGKASSSPVAAPDTTTFFLSSFSTSSTDSWKIQCLWCLLDFHSTKNRHIGWVGVKGAKLSKAFQDTWDATISEENGLNSFLTPFSQLFPTGRIWKLFLTENFIEGRHSWQCRLINKIWNLWDSDLLKSCAL